MTDEDQQYIESLRKHSEKTREFQDYSLKRIDTLIIVISGSGIYISLEMLKFIHEYKLNADEILLKFSGGLFIASIAINFISQWTSYYGNKHEEDWTDKEIIKIQEKNEGKSIDDISQELDKAHKKVTMYNECTEFFNAISTITLVIGILLLVIYSFMTF